MVEPAPLSRHVNDRGLAVFSHIFDRLGQRLGLEDHPRPATIGRIVNRLVLVFGVVPKIVRHHLGKPGLNRTPGDALMNRIHYQVGEDRDNIKPQGSS